MKKIVATIILVSSLAAFSFADSFKFGVKAMTSMNFYSTGVSAVDDNISFGMGWGGGLITHFPLKNGLSLNPELNFQWRKLYNDKYPKIIRDVKTEINYNASELALSVPIMARYKKAIAGLYISTGIQLDFPFSATIKRKINVDNVDYCNALEGVNELEKIGFEAQCSYAYDSRSFLDLGLAVGTGYMFGKSFGVDIKHVLGLLQVDDKKDSKYNQATFSLLWYF
ncbi:MAG: PorT family protein [Fibromonadales bacterium]|nr:PorT family protein [Fibromonadales bacterium]